MMDWNSPYTKFRISLLVLEVGGWFWCIAILGITLPLKIFGGSPRHLFYAEKDTCGGFSADILFIRVAC